MALECCRGARSLILPCRMLGDTGSVAGRSLHGMSLVVVVFLVEELILYAELLVVAELHVEYTVFKEIL